MSIELGAASKLNKRKQDGNDLHYLNLVRDNLAEQEPVQRKVVHS